MFDTMIIRRMTIDDVDAVYAIDQACFARPWPRSSYENEIRENKCARYLVGVFEDKVIGFAGGWVVLDESQVTNIAILEPYRGRGYGKQLTRALLQYFSNLGAAVTTLEVRESNVRARHVYESLGFFRVGRRKKYYTDNGEDALLMLCDHLPEAEPDFEEPETQYEE
ncbi:MAG: ribosomal protein S18-alanine N-acetyltransferase [Clostridiales bacterium]|nr:ribosomal protein S18-alanine N-acetyltransferase [Clostridiales bacterium]